MSGVELDGLRAAAEAAGGCGMVQDCDDPNHEWYRYGELRERLHGGLRTHEAAEFVALTTPSAILSLLDRLADAEAAVERVRAVLAADAVARERCREDDDCPCAYKDCYECGKWHNCTHTPLTGIRDALDGPQRPAGDAVALGGADDTSGLLIDTRDERERP